MSFFRSLIRTNFPVLGIDIGTTSIKIAELENDKGKPRLSNYAILESLDYLDRFNEAIQTSGLKISEEKTAGYLKFLTKKSNFKTKNAFISVPAFLAFSTLVEVPEMSDGELSKFMELQASQYVPLPISSVTIDWMRVGERIEPDGSKKSQALLVSIPNDQIKSYQNIFKLSGLNLLGIEIEGLALSRILAPSLKDPALVIDIGGRSTCFSVVQNGFLKFSGQTDFAGASLTQVISKGLTISQKRAEDLKKQRGLLGLGGEHELSTLILPMLDVIMNEAKRVAANYESAYKEKVAGVILSGGGANLLGIEEYFDKHFGLPVKKCSPFSTVSYPPILDSISKDLGPLLAISLGLGMKNFS